MTMNLSSIDPHTYHQAGQPVPTHVDLWVRADFEAQQLDVREVIIFDKPGTVTFDSFGQHNIKVFVKGKKVTVEIGEFDQLLGSSVSFLVPPSCKVEISFVTNCGAKGLQWLTPAQTGGECPLMYSQFESINGRTVFVLPDSPRIRFTYTLTVLNPPSLRALAAVDTPSKFRLSGGQRRQKFTMSVPVPLYLVALNVGEFSFHRFDTRCGVWAPRSLLEKAKVALARTPEILAAQENLFGPYRWGQYNTIVLPQLGFPFGAMEHPCLTSMNGILLCDQDEATRVTIHEMTHSWFGNLITNASWEDFWLNEGVTTFCEWLVIRAVLGADAMQLQIAQAIEELRQTIEAYEAAGQGGFTFLKQNLTGKDPEDAFSRVPYFKGALFMWALMEKVGESRMIQFLRSYIRRFAFTAIDTEAFLCFVEIELGPEVLSGVDSHAWVYKPGFPTKIPHFHSKVVEEVGGYSDHGRQPDDEVWQRWSDKHRMLYLSRLKLTGERGHQVLTRLDNRYGLAGYHNAILRFEFLRLAAQHEMLADKYLHEIEGFLLNCGRTVYVKPLYRGLCQAGLCTEAQGIFAEAKAGYHPITVEQVQRLLAEYR